MIGFKKIFKKSTWAVASAFLLVSCGSSVSTEKGFSSVQGISSFQDGAKWLAKISRIFTKNATEIKRLHKDISNLERIDVLKNIPVSEIMSAPGHRELRKPEAVIAMAKAIESAGDGGKAFVKGMEPIVLNVYTKEVITETGEKNVIIRSIEVMDGNHRLAAGVLAKMGDAQRRLLGGLYAKRKSGVPVWDKIGDIPKEVLEIRVNGTRASGGGTPIRWIPKKIFDSEACLGPCLELKTGKRGYFKIVQDDRGGRAAEVPGSLSSIDDVIPKDFKGVPMSEVLKTSLQRITP